MLENIIVLPIGFGVILALIYSILNRLSTSERL